MEDQLNKTASEKATKYASEIEHIALNADTADAEAIIHNIRFMAYATGFKEGFKWKTEEE
jgi:hypothetical protein